MKSSHYLLLFADQAIAADLRRKTIRTPPTDTPLDRAYALDQYQPQKPLSRTTMLFMANAAMQKGLDNADMGACLWVAHHDPEHPEAPIAVRAFFENRFSYPQHITREGWELFRKQPFEIRVIRN